MAIVLLGGKIVCWGRLVMVEMRGMGGMGEMGEMVELTCVLHKTRSRNQAHTLPAPFNRKQSQWAVYAAAAQ